MLWRETNDARGAGKRERAGWGLVGHTPVRSRAALSISMFWWFCFRILFLSLTSLTHSTLSRGRLMSVFGSLERGNKITHEKPERSSQKQNCNGVRKCGKEKQTSSISYLISPPPYFSSLLPKLAAFSALEVCQLPSKFGPGAAQHTNQTASSLKGLFSGVS